MRELTMREMDLVGGGIESYENSLYDNSAWMGDYGGLTTNSMKIIDIPPPPQSTVQGTTERVVVTGSISEAQAAYDSCRETAIIAGASIAGGGAVAGRLMALGGPGGAGAGILVTVVSSMVGGIVTYEGSQACDRNY